MGRKITVEEIVTKWGFDVDNRPLERAGALINKLKVGIAAVAATAIAGVAGLFGIAAATAAAGDEAIKTAQSLGITAEALQELRFVGNLAGVTNQEMAVGLRTLSKNLVDFARGSGEAKDALEELGFTPEQVGNFKTIEDVLPLIADQFQKMPDGVKKTNAALRIFGRAGSKLIPLLNAGSGALEEFRKEAQELGFVIDTKTAKASEVMNDNLLRLKLSIVGLRNEIGKEIIPIIAKWADKLKDGVIQLRELITALRNSERAIALLKLGVVLLASALAVLAVAALPAVIELLIAAAAATIAFLIANGPLILGLALMAAKIAFLVLIGEDLLVFFQGGKSATGAWIDEMKEFGGVLEFVAFMLEQVRDGWQNIFKGETGKQLDLLLTLLKQDPVGFLAANLASIPLIGRVIGGNTPAEEVGGRQAVQSVTNQSAVTNTSSTGPITVNGVGGNPMDIAQQVQAGVAGALTQQNRTLQNATNSGFQR